MPVAEAVKLTKVYGSGDAVVTALDAVDLSVEEGEFVAVMGPSGCGKTTLLNLVGGLDRPSSGRVLLSGVDISTLSDIGLTQVRRRQIGFVFQFFNLIPVLSANENAALPLILDGIGTGKAKDRAADWLARFGLSDRLGSRPDQLSGGQQQRVAVARALAAEPKLLLADEPTGNLDTKSSIEIAGLLRQVSEEWGRSVIMVTHDPQIAAHAKRIVFLKDGRVAGDASITGLEDAREAMLRAGLL